MNRKISEEQLEQARTWRAETPPISYRECGRRLGCSPEGLRVSLNAIARWSQQARKAKARSTPEGRLHAHTKQVTYRATEAGGITHVFCNARRTALAVGREFTLTQQTLPSVPATCPVTKLPLRWDGPARDPQRPSLDRIDSTRGYVPGNVAWISWQANKAKSNLSLDMLIALAEYVAAHRGAA